MRLLVLGGTSFVGGAVVAGALARGWSVTTFHRGLTGPDLPGARRILGDRTRPADLAPVCAGSWDAVVDTWAGAPWVVRESAQRLADHAARYAYLSSRAVYASPAQRGLDEGAPTVDASADAEATEYGPDKRGGELAVERAFGERALLARAGLILGPGENLGRLPHWLRRAHRGGEMLAPGSADLPMQFLDVRDLASWLLSALDAGLSGPFNLVHTPDVATTGALLRAAVEETGRQARLVWVSPSFLDERGVDRWSALPGWIPPDRGLDGLLHTDTKRARAHGLKCRPVRETVADTWAWMQANPRLTHPVFGLDPAVEQAHLEAWRALAPC